jgi:hypothetical protein
MALGPKMQQALTEYQFFVGESDVAGQTSWLSPVMIGMVAPVVLGLIVAPSILQGAAGFIGAVLVVVLVFALGAYILSVLAPGEPVGFVFDTQARSAAVLRDGMVARSRVEIPFAEIARLKAVSRSDRDGYERSACELHTRDGGSWIVAADVSDAELAKIRKILGLKSPPQR